MIDKTSKEFAKYLVDEDIATFGEFLLKSGRKSPYFFNFGKLNNTKRLQIVCSFYAQKIIQLGIDFDVIFGPAYKGIPLSIGVANAVQDLTHTPVEFCFNRKSVKKYGDVGSHVGANLEGKRVLITDDVVTSGITISESVKLVEKLGGEVVGFIVALDRQEKGVDIGISAAQFCENNYSFPLISVSSVSDIIEVLKTDSMNNAIVDSMNSYLRKYGAE
ncbi:orotate phosphoribosyltransferase [Marinomonas sp. TI.3.20]|uniref:orotate phosphoribosyltransferase n=1 Tax=Marinomonas sp. TI.3.20 TaxID=3121296 RepID=UPI00311E3BD2